MPSAAYAATLALDGDNIDEKAGDEGSIKRIAFSRWFAKDLASKLTELGIKVAPSAITVTSVTAGSIIVDFDVIVAIADFARLSAAFRSLVDAAQADAVLLAGAAVASAQDDLVAAIEQAEAGVPSPCAPGFSFTLGGGCVSERCGPDERVSNHTCVSCDTAAMEYHEEGAEAGGADTVCAQPCSVVAPENGHLGRCDDLLKVGDGCVLGCNEGFLFVDKMKRTGSDGLGPKRKVPLHPRCARVDDMTSAESQLMMDVECVEEASFVFVILVLILVLGVPCSRHTMVHVQQYLNYKDKLGKGYTWDGRGNEIQPNLVPGVPDRLTGWRHSLSDDGGGPPEPAPETGAEEFENPLQAGKGGLEVDMEEVDNPLSHTVPEDDMEV